MQKPFQGLTFCPTALPEDVSRNVSRKISKLGGGFSKDLTKNVNVLVAGSIATNKYRFAVQHRFDMAFIDAGVIDTIYDLWLTGEDISMESHSNYAHLTNGKDRMLKVLQTRYQLGPLKDFVIFIGRVNDTRDGQLSMDALDNLCIQQGVHSCNTRHFVKETHWSRPTVFVTDQPRGARVDAARLQGLPIVHPKWILDCYNRSALLDFAFYLLENNISTDYDAIGEGACTCWHDVFLHRNSTEPQAPEDDNINAKQSQRIVLDKFATDGDRLWNSVMHKATTKAALANDQPIIKTARAEQTPSLFQDKHCYLLHFPIRQKTILQKIITQNGGSCYDFDPKSKIDQPSYLVVPSDQYVTELALLEKSFTHLVTEFFFERCLHYKKLLTPDPWCLPFFSEFDIIPSQQLSSETHEPRALNVAITGFQGVELLHITKMLDLLVPSGLRLSQTLNKETDFLVINLGALSSIPETHKLWQNQLASMFTESRKIEQNQVHRNSMKRKIEFIKQKHNVPVVTAGFVMEVFTRAHRSRTVGKPMAKIYLNDLNWCISCPKGGKDQYYLELHQRHAASSVKENLFPAKSGLAQKFNSTSHLSIGQSRQEIIQRFSGASPSSKTVAKRSHTESETFLTVPQYSAPPKVPRLVPTEPLQPIQRSSSWGRMLSDQARKAENHHESDQEPAIQCEEPAHTQVTYGSPQQKSDTKAPVRRITRQHMREIDT